MIRKQDLLDATRIASPCHASWDAMEGDDRVRHCGDCRLNVFNIAEMDRHDAIRLIQNAEGRLCIRLHTRRDGTVITRDCPRGMWAVRRKAALALVCGSGLFLSVAALAVGSRSSDEDDGSPWTSVRIHDSAWRDRLPAFVRNVIDKLDPLPSVVAGGMPPPVVQGKINLSDVATILVPPKRSLPSVQGKTK